MSQPVLTASDLSQQLDDIQHNVVSTIKMRSGRHLFLHFNDGDHGRDWLRRMLARVNQVQQGRLGVDYTVNVGMTWTGLGVLGLSQDTLDSFPEAFRMGAQARAGIVSDVGVNAPEHWEGGLGGPDVHAMVLVRTRTGDAREEATTILNEEIADIGGVEVRFVQDSDAQVHEDGTGAEGEHFGFVDPIANPPIDGSPEPSFPGDGTLADDGSWRPLKPGEFVLGYEDEAGDGLAVPAPLELRRNSTYLVFRKIYQDVAAFREFLSVGAQSVFGSDDQEHRDLMAAKLMGRWPSGAPLDLAPDHDDPEIAADPERRNNFTYAGDDEGRRCPVSAHLRRSNPRATPLARGTAVYRHRLLRRSVEYGPPMAEGSTEDDGQDRGLVVLIINADIERQFEFVQGEWMKGGEFMGLDAEESDPIIGGGGEGSQMTVPGGKNPFLFDLPSFTMLKGGEYLFVPSLTALQGIIDRRF